MDTLIKVLGGLSIGIGVFSLIVIITMIIMIRKVLRGYKSKPDLNPGSYNLTPQAAEYRLYWSKETLATIDARCKEIAKKENVDVIDVPIIKQAILEVAHNEWVKLSNRR